MKMDATFEATLSTALDTAASLVATARKATDTEAAKEAIRVARLNLISAYDAITEAEQAARAKYWTPIEQGEPA